MSDNETHCQVSKIVTYILTGGKRSCSYKQLHHWLDKEAATQGFAHRRGFKHHILISPIVVGFASKDPMAAIVTAVHIIEDNLSTSLKRRTARRKLKSKQL